MAMVSSIACSVVEIDNPSANQTPLVFTATFDATKANIDENGKFSWVAGDKINVINAEGTSEEVTLAEADIIDGVAKFTTKQLAASDTYYAVYPSVNYKSLSDGLLKVCPQTIQKVVNQKTCVSVCSGEEMNFCFHNTTCLIKFETELSFHHAVFTALGNEKIHSSFTVNPETGVESAVVGDQGNQVFCNSDGKTGPYFFELAPGVTMASGFSIELRDASETVLASYKNTSSITTARNKILNIKNFDSRIDGKYTVTLSDDAENPLSTVDGKVTLPTREGDDTYSFAGWSTTNIEKETTEMPTIIPVGTYAPLADVTLYPVFLRTDPMSFTLSLKFNETEYYVGTRISDKFVLNTPSLQSDAAVFYVEDNQYLYYYLNQTKTYVSHTGTSSDLNFSTTEPTAWTISDSDNSFTLKSTTSNRYLGYNYNNGNARFAAYVDDDKYPHIFTKHIVSAGVTYYVSGISGSGESGEDAPSSYEWDLTTASTDWRASGNETYFSQPYGYKKANGTLKNTSISAFSADNIKSIKCGFKCLRNGTLVSKITISLVDKDGNTLASGEELELTNQNAASKTEYVYTTFNTIPSGAVGFMMKVTTFGKNVLVNGASYEITYD